jgi:hypothetical protein
MDLASRQMFLAALDDDSRRVLLGILTATDGERAATIGRVHARDDGAALGELLILLEEKEWARQWFVERLGVGG